MLGRLYSFSAVAIILAVTFCTPAQARNEPGDFDYYILALSWSPSYCEKAGDRDSGPQCGGEKAYGFVLHGLWPQYWRGWPQDCRTRDRPWVPRPLIDRMLDIMPSPRLVINEYRKHGTCSGLEPEAYFDLSRTLYNSVRIPERFASPARPLSISASEIRDEFLNSNPQLKPSMVQTVCDGGTFRELRICFAKNRQPKECGEDTGGRSVCSTGPLVVPPVRAGR